MSDFLTARLKISYPSGKINVYENAKNTKSLADVSHPLLYKQLLLLRDEICNDEHKPIYIVANSKSLRELTEYLPTNPDHLMKISGFGEAKVNAYGERFLRLIKEYMLEFDLVSNMDALASQKPKRTKKQKDPDGPKEIKTSSKEQTFNLFKEGLSLSEIAQLRGFALSTLEGHLTSYVSTGEVDIDRLVTKEKQKTILKALESFSKQTGLNPVKSILPADISFGEIRYMLAYREKSE